MKKLLLVVAALASSLSGVSAAEKTVTLAVRNMTCASCPYTVKASLQAVPGVATVAVSYERKTATVVYDDKRTGVKALTAATTNGGYPSAPKS
jgi:mercuric ion binding protein